MADVLWLAVISLVTGLVMALAVRPVLRHLPEPAESEGKTRYGDLATPRFVLTCVVVAMAAQAAAVITLPTAVLPLWTVLATVGVLLVAIDLRTTWLPLYLTRWAWALMLAATALALLLGATLSTTLRALAGAAIAGVLYLFVWAVTRGGFGFGDVRFAPLLGAATASDSWTLLIWALTLGTVVGAGHGATRLMRHRSGAFPYAPAMLGGCYLAAVAAHLLLHEGVP